MNTNPPATQTHGDVYQLSVVVVVVTVRLVDELLLLDDVSCAHTKVCKRQRIVSATKFFNQRLPGNCFI